MEEILKKVPELRSYWDSERGDSLIIPRSHYINSEGLRKAVHKALLQGISSTDKKLVLYWDKFLDGATYGIITFANMV